MAKKKELAVDRPLPPSPSPAKEDPSRDDDPMSSPHSSDSPKKYAPTNTIDDAAPKKSTRAKKSVDATSSDDPIQSAHTNTIDDAAQKKSTRAKKSVDATPSDDPIQSAHTNTIVDLSTSDLYLTAPKPTRAKKIVHSPAPAPVQPTGDTETARSSSESQNPQSARFHRPTLNVKQILEENGLYAPALSRPHVHIWTREELIERGLQHSGTATASPEDRIPDDFYHTIADEPEAPLTPQHYAHLCELFHIHAVMDAFCKAMDEIFFKSLHLIHIPSLLPTDMAANGLVANALSNAHIASSGSGEPYPASPSVMPPGTTGMGPDPVIESFFSIFEQPIKRIVVSPQVTNIADIIHLHVCAHVEEICTLLADWARSLKYIDDGVSGGPQFKPLYLCFLERFTDILNVHQEAAQQQHVFLPDIRLASRFRLHPYELLILWILVAFDISPEFRQALGETWNQQTVVFIHSGVIMRMMASNVEERTLLLHFLSPTGRLQSNGLIKLMPTGASNLTINYELLTCDQVRYQFTNVFSLSLSSSQFGEISLPSLPEDTFMDSAHQKTLDIIKNYLERPNPRDLPGMNGDNLNIIPSLTFLIEGLPGSGRLTLIKILASKLSLPVISVQSTMLPTLSGAECDSYLNDVFLDAALTQSILVFRDAGVILTQELLATNLSRKLAMFPLICSLSVDIGSKIPVALEPYITFKTKMEANLKDNAARIWLPHLQFAGLNRDAVNMLQLAQSMALQPYQIQKAARLAYYSTNDDDKHQICLDNAKLERAAATQVTKNIGNLAYVTDPEITLDDVIVSDDIMEKIKQIIGSAINRRRVLYEWGLSRRIRRGTGVIALFDGEPGTGKTHSAEAIAKTLGLSLMRINIATMVDKYIGETEKNLTTIFEQARPDMQLLLFDEADSLFTKRTANVSKSNDRYSNMSINVLLQLVERYEGVSILTTNLKNAIDPAFERRITYKVYFPMPKKPERERLWKYMCPEDILTSEPIDYEWLSELEMSGGEIKNAVLTAAFQAATKGQLLNSEFLYDAGVSEATAAGRVMRRYDEGGDDVFS